MTICGVLAMLAALLYADDLKAFRPKLWGLRVAAALTAGIAAAVFFVWLDVVLCGA